MIETKRIFTNGCFDVLHKGHIELLKFCKGLGHVTVGLNSDSSVRRLKGIGRPVNTQADRRLVLQALRYVDEVILFEEDTPLRLIQELKPHIIVKGGDYFRAGVVGNEISEVIIFETIEGYSTTNTLKSASASLGKGIEHS
jgi:rfaE bifunctional protein nucleotidyltransferase chain/domain